MWYLHLACGLYQCAVGSAGLGGTSTRSPALISSGSNFDGDIGSGSNSLLSLGTGHESRMLQNEKA